MCLEYIRNENKDKDKKTHLMRRIMRLDVMSDVINIVEVGMAVVDAAQKFPVCFVCCCLETFLLYTLNVYLGAIQIMRSTMATTDQVTMK